MGNLKSSAALSFLEEQIFLPEIRASFDKLFKLREAKKRKVLQHQGLIVLGPEQDDSQIQLEAAKEILKLGDYYPDHLDVHLGGDGLTVILQGLDEGRV
jgi:hypothetical protein